MSTYILKIETEDRRGIIYDVTKILFDHKVNVESNAEFVDNEYGQFFMRVEFRGEVDERALLKEIKMLFSADSTVTLRRLLRRKIVIFVTKESHCIGDILLRWENDDLDVDILGVISNYDTLRGLTEKFKLPYYHIPVGDLTREEHEKKVGECLAKIAEKEPIEYIVLAKYMRILTPGIVAQYSRRIINIHHSFLPAFIGANPYKRAYDRGVKIIGATAHYVTDDLDEGPIIAQEVQHIDHAFSVDALKMVGRDTEKITLSKAIDLVIHDKVFIYKNKTIIL